MGELSVDRLIRLAFKQYRPIRLRTSLWRPRIDVAKYLAQLLKGFVSSGDVLVLSEKALAVAHGFVFDESTLKPSALSRLFVLLLMKIAWGFFLGPLCRLRPRTLSWIRRYPVTEGARHKQLAIKLGGLIEALKPSSEAGVDASNLPFSLVALPLPSPQAVAEELRRTLLEKLNVDLTIVIADSDRMYHHRRLNFALMSRRGSVEGGVYLGFAAFVVGRALRRAFMPLATPIAIAGPRLEKWVLLGLVELADRLRGFGAGRTVFDAVHRFGVPLNGITWGMLESLAHYPVVLFKPRSSVSAAE